ncbi:MAG: M14 family zinc carboxypeptidase [Phycisphaerae bacterium]
MKKWMPYLSCWVCLCLCPGLSAGEGLQPFEPRVVEVALPADGPQAGSPIETMRTWRAWLIERGLSVNRCGMDIAGGRLVLEIDRREQARALNTAGFRIIRALDRAPLEGPSRTQSQYFDPLEIEAMLAQVEADHPTLAVRFPIGTTVQGRTIWALEISDQPGVIEDEPAIQFNGQHHAREVATSHVIMDVVTTLTTNYGTDPDVTNWVNSYKTVCVPMVNPDGVQYVFDVNSFWRKNRNPCSGGTGIDPNRNYPYRWGPAGCGSGSFCASETYRGPFAASELEIQAMAGLVDQYHFVMATSYHAFGRFIDYPYACFTGGNPSEMMPEHAVIKEMMDAMAGAITAVDGVFYTSNSNGSAGPLSGDDTSWYYAHKGTYPFIVEVGTSFEPAFSQVAGIVNRNRGGWQYLYQRLGQARIDVHVTTGCLPIEADVTLTDFVFDTGEVPRVTYLPFGRWTFLVPPNGTYKVQASKAGFVTQIISVPVGNAPAAVSIDLQPTAPPPAPLLGDMDNSCVVDGLDVDLFVQAVLAGPTATPDQILRGDFDGSCLVDTGDLPGFIAAALAGATCP